MTVTVGYARFGSGCTRGHYARIVVPRRTVCILLGRVVVTMRTICRQYTTVTKYRRDIVVNRISVGIRTLRPSTTSRLGGSTIIGTGGRYVVVTGYTALSAGRICLTSSRLSSCYGTARCTITFNRGAGTVLIQRIIANREDSGILRACRSSAGTTGCTITGYICCRTVLLTSSVITRKV